MIRRAALTLLLVATACSPAALLEESPPAPSHDGRYASCTEITEDGVTEHLQTLERRCGR